jgi:hypothetical protein
MAAKASCLDFSYLVIVGTGLLNEHQAVFLIPKVVAITISKKVALASPSSATLISASAVCIRAWAELLATF